jgi:hypothetical protein
VRALSSALLPDPDGRLRLRLVELGDDGSPGQPVVLRGFNLSCAAKNPASAGLSFAVGTAPSLAARAADFLPDLAADGFDLLRVPIVWEHFERFAAAADAIRGLLRYAGDLGFRVIVDIHQDLLGSHFRAPGARGATWYGDGLPLRVLQAAYGADEVPTEWADEPIPGLPIWDQWAINYARNRTLARAMEGLGRAADAFQDFARRLGAAFGDLDNVLTFEVFNEPYSEHMSADVHCALGRAVREGLGPVWRGARTPTCSVMPAGDWLVHMHPPLALPVIATTTETIARRLSLPQSPLTDWLGASCWLITPHYYDPRAGTPPGTPGPEADPTPDRYEAAVQATEALVDAWNAVPVVGEFGVGSNKRARDDCHRAWVDAFERRGWSWCHWNFNPDAGPGGDDRWCDERLSICENTEMGLRRTSAYRALLRPFPRRLGGPLVETKWDGRAWRARIGRAWTRGWRTEITIPASLGEFAVSSGKIDGRTIAVDTDDADVSLEVVTTPTT